MHSQAELSHVLIKLKEARATVSTCVENLETLFQEAKELAEPKIKQQRENPEEFMAEAVRCLTAHERTALKGIESNEDTQAELQKLTDKHAFMRSFLHTIDRKFVETDEKLTRSQIRSLHQVFWSLDVRDVPLTDEERGWVWSK